MRTISSAWLFTLLGFFIAGSLATGCGREEAGGSAPEAAPIPVAPPPPLRQSSAPLSAPVEGMLGDAQATGPGRDLSVAPSWAYAQEPTRNITGPMHRTNVPQVASATDLLFSLGAQAAADGEGLLLCQISIGRDRNWDARGIFGANTAPDPTVRVHLGASPLLKIRIPEDTHEAAFSIPNVSLSAGTPMRFSIVDRDIARDDSIGEATADWPSEGSPRIEVGEAVLRCALASRGWLEERVASATATAARSIALLRDVRPRLDTTSPLTDAPALVGVRRDLHALAALVGWSDAAVVGLRARHDDWEARYWAGHAERVRALIDSTSRGEPAKLGDHLSVSLDRLECGGSSVAQACALELGVRRTRTGGRYTSPQAFLVAPGTPAGSCLALESSLSGRPGLPPSVDGEARLTTHCREPAAGGGPSSWVVLVKSGTAEAALRLSE